MNSLQTTLVTLSACAIIAAFTAAGHETAVSRTVEKEVIAVSDMRLAAREKDREYTGTIGDLETSDAAGNLIISDGLRPGRTIVMAANLLDDQARQAIEGMCSAGVPACSYTVTGHLMSGRSTSTTSLPLRPNNPFAASE